MSGIPQNTADQAQVTLHSTLRFAVGVTIAFLLCEIMGWMPTFLAPVLAAVLLTNLPTRPPLKLMIGLVLIMSVAALFAFALASLLRGIPIVLFGAVALCMFLCFHAAAMGKPALPPLLALICLATIPVVVMVAPAHAGVFPVALIRGIAVALVLVWAMHGLWPRVRAPQVAPTAVPGPVKPVTQAIFSVLVVMPLMLVYMLFGWADILPVLVATVMLVINFDLQRSRMQALGMVLGNFAGGLLGLLLHTLLSVAPGLIFLALILFIALMGFGQRIAAGGPMAGVALIACNAMLIILSSAIASDTGSLVLWLVRVLQFGLAGAFAIGMMTLIWFRAVPFLQKTGKS